MRHAFTLLELVVVMVIIGILVSLGVPQYILTTERSRAAEGISILGAIRGAQLRYALEYGSYATMCKLDSAGYDSDCAGMDIEIPQNRLRFFSSVWAHQYPGFLIVGVLIRNNVNRATSLFGNYILYIDENGTICCNDNGAGGSCDRLNIPAICAQAPPS